MGRDVQVSKSFDAERQNRFLGFVFLARLTMKGSQSFIKGGDADGVFFLQTDRIAQVCTTRLCFLLDTASFGLRQFPPSVG